MSASAPHLQPVRTSVQPTLTARVAKAPEAATSWIERWTTLDRLGEIVARIGGLVRPGLIKDALSGTWMGHPLHPLLTDIPIGAWTSSLILDTFGNEETHAGSDALIGVGVLASLPTAVAGITDLADTEDKPSRRLGVVHAGANVLGLGLYALSYLYRRTGKRRAGVTLSTLGAAAMTAGGFLGGHLSYRKGVGVDQTAFRARVRRWTPVLDASELPEGTPKMATVSGTDILLYREDGRLFALANRCSHRGGPLNKGEIGEGPTVTCPWHLSTFDLEDGSIVRGPASSPQPGYDVRENDGKIEIRTKS